MDDNQILSLIRNKKTRQQGFKLLVNQSKTQLYWQIRRMVLSHEDTDDILQDTYIKIFTNISSFNGKSSLMTWIYRIAFNETVNFLNSKRKKNEKHNISLEQEMIENLSQDKYFDFSNTNILLEKAILSLPAKQRIVFNLRYYDNIPFKQMEEILNTTESALKTSYHIAEKKIREFLSAQNLNF